LGWTGNGKVPYPRLDRCGERYPSVMKLSTNQFLTATL
jgi:hypothetical protein